MKLRVSRDAALMAAIILVFLGAHMAVDALDRHDARKAQEKQEAEIQPVYVTEISEPVDVIEAIVEIPEISVEVEAPEEPEIPAEEDVAIPEPDEDQKIEAALKEKGTRLDDVTITHYCICKKCCGKDPDHPAYGITASGAKAQPNVTVAVDPKVIPLGSDVLVDYGDGEIHSYIAQDTGGAVDGYHLDLCVSDHQTAINLGVKNATVWFIAPEK